MDAPDKEVFIVHSRSDEREHALTDALVPRLHEAGIPVWDYEDWSWEHRVRRSDRGQYRHWGRIEELDYARHQMGDPQPFRAPVDEVDEATLAEMLHRSQVVLLYEPRAGASSEGVLKERRVLAGLAKGPILVHLLWPDSAGDFFARLRPALEIRLAESSVSAVAVDEVFAGVAAAWLVHNLQRRHGRQGGHRVLAAVPGREPILREIIEHSPAYLDPQESDVRIKDDSESAVPSKIRALFARQRPFEAAQFEKWWTDDLAVLKTRANELAGGPTVRVLHALLDGIERSWHEAFGSGTR